MKETALKTPTLMNAALALIAVATLSACAGDPVIPAPSLTSTPLGTVGLAWDTAKRLAETDSSGTISLEPRSYSDIDDVKAGVRYLTATFRVTNLSPRPLEHLTLRALSNAGSLGGTALRDLRAFPDAQNPDGLLLTDANIAQSARPLHAMKPTDNAPQPDSSASDFQGYLPSESAALQAAALDSKLLNTGDSILDYGYMVRGDGASRRLGANGGTGLLSLAVRLPRRAALPGAPSSKVFKFEVTLLVTTDSRPRVTRALLEPTSAAEARAATLGADTQLLLIGEPGDAIGNALRVGNLRIGTGTNLLP